MHLTTRGFKAQRRRYSVRILTGLMIALAAAGSEPVRAQRACAPENCRLPQCLCASTSPPGGLDPSETPQFIVVTFDDAITAQAEGYIGTTLDGLVNPDGRPALRTYFTNKTYTYAPLARALYQQGHELANHTASHNTGVNTTVESWRAELSALSTYLQDVVGVREGDVAGFRAPYLETNEALWGVLKELGFLYDASLPEQVVVPPVVSTGLDAFVWPHTLDFGAALSCVSSACPVQPVPGLWTVPLWVFQDDAGGIYGPMDVAVGFDSLFEQLLEAAFSTRYTGNRAPLGLYFHAGQMWSSSRQAVLHTFLRTRLQKPDVWMITLRGLIEWMKAPLPNRGLSEWFDRGCDRGGCAIVSNVSTPDPALGRDRERLSSYPNPFSEHTTVVYHVAETGPVQLHMLDVLGRVVDKVVDEVQSAGTYEVSFRGSDHPPGLYLGLLTTRTHTEKRLMIRSR